MTKHGVREQARFDDSVGIYPEFIGGYGVLILPTTADPEKAVDDGRPIRGDSMPGRCRESFHSRQTFCRNTDNTLILNVFDAAGAIRA